MMYPYMTLADDTEIVHSHIIRDGETKKVIVHFERPTDDGFDVARCELPSCIWMEQKGFSSEEMDTFEELLQSNEHLIYKYAETGGVRIA